MKRLILVGLTLVLGVALVSTTGACGGGGGGGGGASNNWDQGTWDNAAWGP